MKKLLVIAITVCTFLTHTFVGALPGHDRIQPGAQARNVAISLPSTPRVAISLPSTPRVAA